MNLVETNSPDDHMVRRRPTQERSRQRFDAILAAATRLIATSGLAPVTVTDIAEEAGMGLPAVYRYFPNKQAIVRELTLNLFAADAEMTSAFTAHSNAGTAEQIATNLATYCHHHRANRVRLQVRAAVYADAELSLLDLADSRTNAVRLAAAIDRPGLGIPRLVLEARALMLVEILDGVIRLASRIDDAEADQVINEFAQMASQMMLREHNETTS